MDKLKLKLYVYDTLHISPKNPSNMLSGTLPYFRSFEILRLNLFKQILTLREFKLITPMVHDLHMVHCKVLNLHKLIVPIEELLAEVPNLEFLHLWVFCNTRRYPSMERGLPDSQNPNVVDFSKLGFIRFSEPELIHSKLCYSAITGNQMERLNFKNKIFACLLFNVPSPFDPISYANFIKVGLKKLTENLQTKICRKTHPENRISMFSFT